MRAMAMLRTSPNSTQAVERRSIKISVIVPIYNVEELLPRCIDSLTRQTLKDIEIILIDDGSPDNCGKICDEYAGRDKRIKVIHQKNGGVARARNAGMSIARGEYIGFCDPDDWVDKDFYEHLHIAAAKTNSDIAKGLTIRKQLHGKLDFGPSFKMIRENRAWFKYSFWTAIYKRNFLKKNQIEFPAGIITGQDVVFLTKAVLLANKIELVDNKSYYHYFKRDNSLDSEYLGDAKIKSKIDGIGLIFNFINEIKPDFETYNIVFSNWLNYLVSLFYRTNVMQNKMLIVQAAIKFYRECKYKEAYRKYNEVYAKFLSEQDETGLFLFLLNKNKKGGKHFSLFGIIPLLKIINNENRQSWQLFNFIPLMLVRHKPNKTIYRLFGFLPLLYKKGV
jgi:glycosyltransferase involved in cell wall biosynthesis